MKNRKQNLKTIAAIATPPGRGALGIVRLSGPDSHVLASRILRRTDGSDWPKIRSGQKASRLIPNHLYLGRALSFPKGQEIDEVMVSFFNAPKSYTGEDMVEIYGHGGPVSLQEILRSSLRSGAILAKPGEFTRRAFLHGRISLSQAEAVGDLIEAKTGRAARLAWRQLAGDHDKWTRQISRKLEQVLGSITAELEFPDDIPGDQPGSLLKALELIRRDLADAVSASGQAIWLKQGIRAAIFGRANVGKSTLFNALLGRERAITSPWPGTTRDFIEESFEHDGLPVILIDTAGWKGKPGPLDRLGWRKAKQVLATADIVILVLDASGGLKAEDRKFWQLAGQGGRKIIVALNKIDKGSKIQVKKLANIRPATLDMVKVSALKGRGLGEIKKTIGQLVPDVTGSYTGTPAFSNTRHLDCLQQALKELDSSIGDLKQKEPLDIVSLGLNRAWEALGEMTGEKASERLLDSIFSRFCLGK